MPFDVEHVAKAVLTLLQGELGAALDAVETEWTADPLTLAEPVTWHYGHKPTVVEMESTGFPFVAVIPMGRKPVRRAYAWGFQDQSMTIYVDWFIVATTETAADKMCSRYGQALLAVLQSQRALYGYDQVDFEPQVDLSEASRHPQTIDADMFDDAQVDFIKMGRITMEFGNA